MKRVLSNRTLFRVLIAILVSSIVLFSVERWLVMPFNVTSSSMSPELKVGDRILIEHSHASVKQLRHKVERGDVIIFRSPQRGAPLVIKRVIGLPGEMLQAKNGVIAIDNERILVERWLTSKQKRDSRAENSVDIPRIVLTNNQVYVLGDNRLSSIDSRSFGPVELDRIVGRKAIRIWPLNRVESLDWSRRR